MLDYTDTPANGVAEALDAISPAPDARVKTLMSTPAPRLLKGLAGRTSSKPRAACEELEIALSELLEIHGLAAVAELDDRATILLSVEAFEEGDVAPLVTLKTTAREAITRGEKGVKLTWTGAENRIQHRIPGGGWSEPGSLATAVAYILAKKRDLLSKR